MQIKLQDLSITTYIYNQYTKYDQNYTTIKDDTFDFEEAREVEKLIQFPDFLKSIMFVFKSWVECPAC